MEKIKMNYHELDTSSMLKYIKSFKTGLDIINLLNLTDEEVIKYYELLCNYIKINISCERCNNMNNCDHSTKGHKYGLKKDEDNEVTDYFYVCNLYKEYYLKKKNLIFTTFNEEELLDNRVKSFIIDNANLLGSAFIKKVIALQKNESINGAFLHLADSKLRLKLIKSLSYVLLSNHSLSVVKFSDLLKEIKSTFKSKINGDFYEEMLSSDVLIIDGLGSEAISSWSRDEILLSILDSRLQMDKPTLLCSEFSIEELRKLYKLGYNDEAKANQIIEKIIKIMS